MTTQTRRLIHPVRSFVFLSLLLSTALHASCQVTDSHGQQIQLNRPAQRVISLAPDLTEVLFSVGADKQIVGVIDGSDYPAEARTITKIGSYTGIDLEKIVTLHPDLIVTWGNGFARSLESLKALGIPVYVNDPKRLEDVAKTMRDMGCLAGRVTASENAATRYLQRLALIKNNYSQQPKIKVFFQIGSSSLITINRDSWINQAISICGGDNVFQAAKFAAPEVTWEAVIAANPAIVLSDAMTLDWQKNWKRWSQITAVQRGALYSIPPDLIERAGPRLLFGVEMMCRQMRK